MCYLFGAFRQLRYKLHSTAIEEAIKRSNFALIIYNLDRLLYYRTILLKGKFLAGLSRLPDGNYILHPIGDMNILDEIYLGRVYEKIRGIRDGDVVVDCGAHVGIFTIKAASAGASYVLSVEPDSINFAFLRFNVNHLGLSNVEIVNAAIGRKNERAREIRPWGRRVVVPIRSIRSLASQHGISRRIDFLKIDVEGAEVEALEGLKGVNVGTIAIEYHGKGRKEKVERKLHQMGFEVSSLEGGELGYIFASSN